MARNRKIFIHNTALLVTSRIEEGLPLVPTHCLNTIVWGILARAQGLYPVRICHFVFLANHFHMIVVVHNPEDVSRFTGYVKGEIARAVNKLLGRKKKTIWDKGYDSPAVLSAEDVLRYIEYIYTNPTRPGLVDTIDEYPGVSSWEMFQSGVYAASHKYISRDEIPTLPFASLGINEQKKITETLLSEKTGGSDEQFYLDPYAWLDCFPGFEGVPPAEAAKENIIAAIRDKEERYRAKRLAENKVAAGATSLRRQSMLKEHTPEKVSRRMICLCSDKELRWRFVAHFKALCAKAEAIYEKWKRGETHLRIPPGLLAPRMPNLASLLMEVT